VNARNSNFLQVQVNHRRKEYGPQTTQQCDSKTYKYGYTYPGIVGEFDSKWQHRIYKSLCHANAKGDQCPRETKTKSTRASEVLALKCRARSMEILTCGHKTEPVVQKDKARQRREVGWRGRGRGMGSACTGRGSVCLSCVYVCEQKKSRECFFFTKPAFSYDSLLNLH